MWMGYCWDRSANLAMMEVTDSIFRRPVLVGLVVRARMTVVGTCPSTRDLRRGVRVRHLAVLDDQGEVLPERAR
jgi:acyl dehydratase